LPPGATRSEKRLIASRELLKLAKILRLGKVTRLEKRLTFKKPVDKNLVFDNFQPRRRVIHGGTGF
jgi:hypothetical protein